MCEQMAHYGALFEQGNHDGYSGQGCIRHATPIFETAHRSAMQKQDRGGEFQRHIGDQSQGFL